MNVKQSFFSRLTAAGLTLSLLLGLAACSVVPLRSLWSLRQFELSQLDATQLRLPVYLPLGLATARDAIQVKVRAERGNAAQEVMEETLTLRPSNPEAPLPVGLQPPRPGGHWLLLSLDAAEQQRLQQLRARLLAWKAADGSDTGRRRLTLSAQPQLCAQPASRPLDLDALRISAWVRWQPGQADLLLVDDARLQDLPGQPGSQPLPRCG